MSNPELQTDWHEHEEAAELVYLLGKFSLEWNMVEQFQTGFLWELLGEQSTGMAITGNLGNRSKSAIISDLASQRPDADVLLPSIRSAEKTFSSLQANRNILLHSHSIFPRGDKKPEWRKATGRGPHGHVSVFADENDLEILTAQVVEIGRFYVELTCYSHCVRRGESYDLPEDLSSPLKLRIVDKNPDPEGLGD